MSLKEYWEKRNFGTTNEPKGKVREKMGNDYVIQKHYARRLHYDLRLERRGVLKSWAVPKSPPTKNGVKRLAIETEDHPVEYANFEGIIPEGQYGAGKVGIWDKGTYKTEKWNEDEVIIHINGDKLNGRFCLIKFKKEENSWLFFKC